MTLLVPYHSLYNALEVFQYSACHRCKIEYGAIHTISKLLLSFYRIVILESEICSYGCEVTPRATDYSILWYIPFYTVVYFLG